MSENLPFKEFKKRMLEELDYTEVDKQIVDLIKGLNKIDGIVTTESCCGHGKERCRIWFNAETYNILEDFVYECLNCFSAWEIVMEHYDVGTYARFPGKPFRLECIYQDDLLQESIDNLIFEVTKYNNK